MKTSRCLQKDAKIVCSVVFAYAFVASFVVSTPTFAVAEEDAILKLLDMPLDRLLDEKVSVASHFEQTKLQANSTVAVIERREWELTSSRRLHDAIAHLPSTMILPGLFGGDNITIRGYAQTEPTGVATLWDGVPLSTLQSGTAQFDHNNIGLATLDRIEMIRGPGSALYGSDAFHGVLALSAFESKTDVNKIESEVADNGFYQAGINHSSALGQDTRLNFSSSVSGQGDQDREFSYTNSSSGQRETAEHDYHYQSKTAVLKLVSDPVRDFSYRLGLYWDNNDADEFPGFGTRENDLSGNDSNFYMTKFSMTQKFTAEWSMELSGYYWGQNHVYDIIQPGGNRVVSDADEHQSGVNLVVKQPDAFGNTQLSLDIGYRQATIEQNQRDVFTPAGVVVSSGQTEVSGLEREIYSASLEAKSRFINDKLSLHWGGRYDDYSDFGNEFSPRLGVVYQPQQDKAVKLLYGRAFRAPFGVELRGTLTRKGNPNIQPETIDTYELIFMQQTKSWSAELVLFASRWKDGIIVVPSSDPNFNMEFANQGENKSQGVEFITNYHLTNWRLNASASYVESENTVSNADYVAFPKWIFNLGIGYERAGYSFYLNNRIHVDADQGPVTGTNPHPPQSKDYWRTDLHIDKETSDRLRVFLNIRNLFDRDNALPSVNNAEGGVPDESLNASVGLRYQF